MAYCTLAAKAFFLVTVTAEEMRFSHKPRSDLAVMTAPARALIDSLMVTETAIGYNLLVFMVCKINITFARRKNNYFRTALRNGYGSEAQ